MTAKFHELWQGLLARHPWRWALYLVPFTYEFHKCSFDDFREAWIELLVMTFFSTMPLWIMAILGPVIFQTDISFTDQLLSTISGGELFVYCAALIGPLIYIITRRYGETSQDQQRFSVVIAFPHGLTFVLFSALICVLAGIIFSLMKNPVLTSHDQVIRFNQSGIFWSSIGVYVFSLYCFFSASAYRNAMAGFMSAGHTDEDTFAAAWESRSNAREP
jgi:hypothetical protein